MSWGMNFKSKDMMVQENMDKCEAKFGNNVVLSCFFVSPNNCFSFTHMEHKIENHTFPGSFSPKTYTYFSLFK